MGEHPFKIAAVGGAVMIELPDAIIYCDPPGTSMNVRLTPEEADAFWNQVAEAELVALEQRVRARRRVTEGARGGWADAPAQGRHAADAGMALAEHTAAALNRLAPRQPDLRGELPETWKLATMTGTAWDVREQAVKARAEVASALAALDREEAADRRAAPEPGDPYPAPDYQHPDDDDD